MPDASGVVVGPNLPDTQFIGEGVIKFLVYGIEGIQEAQYSDAYRIRNLPWRVLVEVSSDRQILGIFISCEASETHQDWSCTARIQLKVPSFIQGKPAIFKSFSHNFKRKSSDIGLAHFALMSEILDPENGFLKDNTLTVEAKISCDAPHGTGWDSKALTGFNGLKNQGATCYMNSLLQSLFFINKFRKTIYWVPTDYDVVNKNVALALQFIFFNLQTADHSVCTNFLSEAIGWDSFVQQDVQESCRLLLDSLEHQMRNSNLESEIPNLFKGQMVSHINCKNVKCSSRKEETFYDIQLKVQNNKDIYESFDEFCRVETMEGENKYAAENFGLQEAEKFVKFSQLPPVLHIQLIRFSYDRLTPAGRPTKINDELEFPENLNLAKYLEIEDSDIPSEYILHSVLVHSGDTTNGHYIVFISPETDGQWVVFDDEVVNKVSKTDALNNNFGGTNEHTMGKANSSAYMLVYVRKDKIQDLLEPVVTEDVPFGFKKRMLELAEEREHEIKIQVVLEDYFFKFDKLPLLDHEQCLFKNFAFNMETRTADVFAKLAEFFNQPAKAIRPWGLFYAEKRSKLSFVHIDVEKVKDIKIKELCTDEGQKRRVIFLEILSVNSEFQELPEFNPDTDLLVFFKKYMSDSKKLCYIGHQCLPKTVKISYVASVYNSLAGFEEGTLQHLFEADTGENKFHPLENFDSILVDALKNSKDSVTIVGHCSSD